MVSAPRVGHVCSNRPVPAFSRIVGTDSVIAPVGDARAFAEIISRLLHLVPEAREEPGSELSAG